MGPSVSLVQLQRGRALLNKAAPQQTLVRLNMGCLFTAPRNAQDCGHLPFLQIGPTSFKCTVSARHGRNMGSTWGQLWPTRPQLRPKLGQLGSNLPQLGPKLETRSAFLIVFIGLFQFFVVSMMLRIEQSSLQVNAVSHPRSH